MNVVICVSSAAVNCARRKAIRRSWFNFKTGPSGCLTEQQKASVNLFFVVCAGSAEVEAEQEANGDMLLVNAAEGYEHLWRKALTSLLLLEGRYEYTYYMHADDDSYVRLDLVLQLLEESPRQRFYWGYIWDGTGNRCTAPIRNPRNKSHMPVEQYALDFYPPFASGCGFILSHDLVQALLKQPLPDYRLLDPPFGVHLCGSESCVLPEGPVQPVHDDRVRPYRGIPIFQPDTVVQHYLAPEEMAPFHAQVLEWLSRQPAHTVVAEGEEGGTLPEADMTTHGIRQVASEDPGATPTEELYRQLVDLGLLRR